MTAVCFSSREADFSDGTSLLCVENSLTTTFVRKCLNLAQIVVCGLDTRILRFHGLSALLYIEIVDSALQICYLSGGADSCILSLTNTKVAELQANSPGWVCNWSLGIMSVVDTSRLRNLEPLLPSDFGFTSESEVCDEKS